MKEKETSTVDATVSKFRVFYEVQEDTQMVTVVAVGHKEHATRFIRGVKVKL